MKPFGLRTLACAGLLLACVAASARAEIEPVVPPGGQYVPAMTLPKLPRIAGWTLNPSASLSEHARVLLPVGKSLGTTDVMISAIAYPKTMLLNTQTIDGFIAAVQASDQRGDSGRASEPGAPLTDKSGQVLKVYSFHGSAGAVGEAAYGTETSGGIAYWTVFTISARDDVAFSDNVASFRNLIAAYQ